MKTRKQLLSEIRSKTENARALLNRIEIGKPRHFRNLTLFPLTVQNGHDPVYTLLAKAIKDGKAEVTEVDDSGTVPTLLVHNLCGMPLLIPEGEILIGAKQNRVTNITIIMIAKSNLDMPVSCVEQGRWHRMSRGMRSAYSAPPSLRGRKLRSVIRNRASTGEALSDQGDVWDCVGENLDDLGASSDTGSVTAAFEASEQMRTEYRKHFRLPRKAQGFLVAHGDKIIGMDLFDCHDSLKQLWKRLTDAYFVEAARTPEPQAPTSPEVAQEFVKRIAANLQPAQGNSMGAGVQLEVVGDNTAGTGVWFQDHLCHLSAFAVDN